MNDFIFLPRPYDFSTLNMLTVLMLIIHLPYAGCVIGATLLSVICSVIDFFSPNKMLRRFSKDVVDMCVGNLGVVIMLGILPPLSLMLIFSQFFWGQPFREYNILGLMTIKGTPMLFFAVITALSAIGFLHAFAYRETWAWRKKGLFWPQVGLGFGAHGALITGFFIYSTSTTLFTQPVLWKLVRTPVPLLFDWNAIARFGLLSHCFLVVFGLWIVFYRWRWRTAPEGEVRDEKYENFIRYLGSGIAIGFLLPLPAIALWVIGTLPQSSYTVAYFGVVIAAVIVMAVCAVSIWMMLSRASLHAMPTALVSFLVVLFFFIVNDQLARESANRALRNKQIDVHTRIKLADESQWEVAITLDLAEGEKTYKNICSTCHAFDKKLVGPPYNTTLAKYENDFTSLVNFISNPYKIDPGYPAMPKQPINKSQTYSVAAWIMKEAGLKHPTTMEEATGVAAGTAAPAPAAAPAGEEGGSKLKDWSTLYPVIVRGVDGEVPPGNSLYSTGHWQDVSALEGAKPAPVGPAGARALPRAHAPTGVHEYGLAPVPVPGIKAEELK